MFSDARECICVAWRSKKRNEISRVSIYKIGEVQIDDTGKKRDNKVIKLLNIYYGWHCTRCFTYAFASKSCDNTMR